MRVDLPLDFYVFASVQQHTGHTLHNDDRAVFMVDDGFLWVSAIRNPYGPSGAVVNVYHATNERIPSFALS
jgi:hypothetical protein